MKLRWILDRLTCLSWLALLLVAAAFVYSVVLGGVVNVRQFDQDMSLIGVEYNHAYGLRAGHAWRTQIGEGLSGVPLQEVDRTFTYASAHDETPPLDAVPLWPAIVVLAVLPVIGIYLRFAGRRRYRRRLRVVICEAIVWLGGAALLAAIIFCIRSYPNFERLDIRLAPGPAALQVNSSQGSLMLAWTRSGPERKLRDDGAFLFQRSTRSRYPAPLRDDAGFVGEYISTLGFASGGDGTTAIGRHNIVIVPYWFVFSAIVALTLPFALVVRRQRRRYLRAATGLCAHCGYDLRGITTGCCPECGTPIPITPMPQPRREPQLGPSPLNGWAIERIALLCVFVALATTSLWVHTDRHPTEIRVLREDWRLITKFVYTSNGALRLGNGTVDGAQLTPYQPVPSEQTDRTFTVIPDASWPASPNAMPLWPIVAVAAVFPLALLIVRFRRRRGSILGTIFAWYLMSLVFVIELLLVAAIVFCVRSYPYFERFDLRVVKGNPAALQVNSSRGSLMFAWTESGPNHSLPGDAVLYTRSTIPEDRGPLYQAAELREPYEQWAGFTVGSDGTTPLKRNVLIVPYWSVFLVLLVARWMLSRPERARRRRARYPRERRCTRCDYDLRGSRERCPECGTPFATNAAVASAFTPSSP